MMMKLTSLPEISHWFGNAKLPCDVELVLESALRHADKFGGFGHATRAPF